MTPKEGLGLGTRQCDSGVAKCDEYLFIEEGDHVVMVTETE